MQRSLFYEYSVYGAGATPSRVQYLFITVWPPIISKISADSFNEIYLYPDKRTNPDWTLVRDIIALELFSCNIITSHAIRTNIPDGAQVCVQRNCARCECPIQAIRLAVLKRMFD
jgi:hypothetical protein